MTTVVTGGAGFIGSHLVRALLSQGREVIIIDDFSRGSKLNLIDLDVRIDCQRIDLSDFAQVLKATRGADVVFHLAARIGNLDYLHGSNINELKALQTNLVIDANVFRACLENNVKKLIYGSSTAVYPIDLQRSYNVILSQDALRYYNPDGGYGWAKLIGEIQLEWVPSIDIGIARIFNVYGENMNLFKDAHVIPTLIRKAILYPKEGFVVCGDGKQSRDFLYVSDCVDAMLELEKRASNPPIVANIGSGQPFEIATIAERIVNLSGKDIQITYDTTKPVGPLSRTADISQSKVLLEWEPRIDLNEGLRRTYAWAKRRLERVKVL